MTSIKKTLVILFILAPLISCTAIPHDRTPLVPYQDPSLPTEQRVADLVDRMTLEEKISQMMNQAPAIERLGIPEYNWWSEGLHGVARAGLATVFPQAIGLAATWDDELMLQVASAIGDEARAKHHNFARQNKRFIYQGLTLWSPNINIFRDPRWGRGQETYGEDPYLTARMGVQFVKGLQGNHPHYLKTVATVKHFAVHNGPEPVRHEFDAKTNPLDLMQTYLPQFEATIKEAKAASVMCAYNRYNGEPACSSELLLKKILRSEWQFDGFVVSDCGAIEDLHKHHRVTDSPAQSAAQAVLAGTDLNCGRIYESLLEAVNKGLIDESSINESVARLFTARMKLGQFDPQTLVPYSQIPYELVDSPKHRELALNAARKSIVLLKNDKNTLPLAKDLSRIAVIGPNADQWLMLLGNYNGVPSSAKTPLQGIREAVSPQTEIVVAQGSELADGIPMLYPIPASTLSSDQQPGLEAQFFANSKLQAPARHTSRMANVDINWQDKAPYPDLDDDNFSVRWRGTLTPRITGLHQLGVISTCNTKVYINGELVVSTPYHFRDEYGDPRTKKSDWLPLKQGETYEIEVTAIETYADAQVQLVWAEPKPNLMEEALGVAKDADVVVMVMGLTARMEGEEMAIQVDGFNGGDRTKLTLPKTQEDLLKKVHALGKPVVLVLLNGSALAIPWADKNIPAIVEAWYPGQAAGDAIADVIFGDYNPAGRLPVTFYHSVNDLPPFDDYNLTSQTYRFFTGEPLYPFGYGLSYSHFQYQNLNIPHEVLANQPVNISVEIKNQSSTDGEEVVQVYVAKQSEKNNLIHQLCAFKRVPIAANKSEKVSLSVSPACFQKIDDNGEKSFNAGTHTIFVGGGQPNQKKHSSNHLKATIIARN